MLLMPSNPLMYFLLVSFFSGYQRELKYKHKDGSFSAFGESDEVGSMWLTAFVVKCFGQSLPFIAIDRDQWRESVNWITRQQFENGCFPSVGKVIHSDLQVRTSFINGFSAHNVYQPF